MPGTDIILEIVYYINEPNKTVIRTNAKKEAVEEILEVWLSCQTGLGEDKSKPNKKDKYIIQIQVDLSFDILSTSSDTENKSLTCGIIGDVFNGLDKIKILNFVKYPYLPEGKQILYVNIDNKFMAMARDYAREHSLDKTMPGAAVIVKDGAVLGIGANGSDYHEKYPCKRVELGCKSGKGYELCEGCHPKNHSEPAAINDATKRGNGINDADLYLWGHWWLCEPCWNAIIEAEINNVYLLDGSEKLFNKEDSDNIVGKQFE